MNIFLLSAISAHTAITTIRPVSIDIHFGVLHRQVDGWVLQCVGMSTPALRKEPVLSAIQAV